MKKLLCATVLSISIGMYCVGGVSNALFSALGGIRGYVNEDTGLRHATYFVLGGLFFEPLAYYSLCHMLGSTYAKFARKVDGRFERPAIMIYERRRA